MDGALAIGTKKYRAVMSKNISELHEPVLLERAIELLAPAFEIDSPVFVDCTLGLGGHSEAFLERFPNLTLVGIDRDPTALALAGERLARFGSRVHLVHAVYEEIQDVIAELGIKEVHGILLDLGVSSMQLDEAVKKATATIPAANRKLLTYHDAYAYFSDRYGYEVVGAIQPQSFEEPSPKDITTLIDQVKKEGVIAIFGSEVFPSPVLEQIGKETGVRYVDTLRDDDLLGEPGDADHSWAALMRSNYMTMVSALGGDAAALKAIKSDIGLTDKAHYPQ